MKVKRPYLTYFLMAVGIIAVFELLFLFHAWVDAYSFEKIDSSGLITIWAAVLTIVFLVFSVMGLMNIDSRIKDLNETRERLSNMEREMKEEVRKMKVSAEEEKRKIIKKAEEEVVKIMNKSAERQNIFDQLTQIALSPYPLDRIRQYTEVLKTKSEADGVNIGFIHCKRAEAYKELQQDDYALADYEQALKLIPNEVDPYLGMGCFYVERKKDYPKSIEYFEKAAKLRPTLGVVYSNMANSYGAMGDYVNAEKYYKMADDCGVESFEWYYNKALTIMKSEEPDPNGVIQEKYYRYCLKLNPHFFPAALNLAMIYRERNEDGKAEQQLSELITTSLFRPDFVKCIIQRGICTMKMNRFAEALNDFALAYVAAPKDPQVMCNLAWCHFRLGHIMEADEYAHVGREYAKIENNQGIVDDLTNLIGNIELMDSKIRAMQGS